MKENFEFFPQKAPNGMNNGLHHMNQIEIFDKLSELYKNYQNISENNHLIKTESIEMKKCDGYTHLDFVS